MKKSNNIIPVAFLLLLFLSSYVIANPTPPPPPPPGENSSGGPTPYGDCFVKFVSENVTVYISDKAHVFANYTFTNLQNESIIQTILLPFYYSQPEDLKLSINENELNFIWTDYIMNSTDPNNYPFGNNIEFEYDAAEFNITIEAHQTVILEVDYTRNYPSNHHYDKANFDQGRYSNYVYLTRSGALWEQPIEYANFNFYVDKDLCSGNFIDDSDYKEFYNYLKDFHEPIYDLYALANLTEFFTQPDNLTQSYFHFQKTFYDWVPQKDLGVSWANYYPEATVDLEYFPRLDSLNVQFYAENSTASGCNISNYYWNIIYGSESICNSNNSQFQHIFFSHGMYQVDLLVSDDMNLESSDKDFFFLYPKEYDITFNISRIPVKYLGGYAYLNEIQNCVWYFSDGTRLEGNEIIFHYNYVGCLEILVEFEYDNREYQSRYELITIEVDSDGDGYGDDHDRFPLDPTEWVDSDIDGIGDNSDDFPNDPNEWQDSDGDGVGDNSDDFPFDPNDWQDSDGDGYGDNRDVRPNDPTEWNDTDGDGYCDNTDKFPLDSNEWNDTDDDGVGDNTDAFPNDRSEWIDTDGDGIGDNSDIFPLDKTEWADIDGDGIGNNADWAPMNPSEWNDGDGDGYGDNSDHFPLNPTEWVDSDGDGYGNNIDCFPYDISDWYDTDNDGIGDNNDFFPMDPSASRDTDKDGHPDFWNRGKSKRDSTTNLTLDDYPMDPTRWTEDLDVNKNQVDNMQDQKEVSSNNGIFWIIIIIFLLLGLLGLFVFVSYQFIQFK